MWNLTYDLIEPFRAFVDRIVYEKRDDPFDREYKKVLIEVGEARAIYNGKKMTVTNAVECFCISVLKSLAAKDADGIQIGKVKMLCETE